MANPWETVLLLKEKRKAWNGIVDDETYYAERPEEKFQLDIANAECKKKVLEAELTTFDADLRGLPEWPRLKELKDIESDAAVHFMEAEDWEYRGAADALAGAEVDVEIYMEEVFLPAAERRLANGAKYVETYMAIEELKKQIEELKDKEFKALYT